MEKTILKEYVIHLTGGKVAYLNIPTNSDANDLNIILELISNIQIGAIPFVNNKPIPGFINAIINPHAAKT